MKRFTELFQAHQRAVVPALAVVPKSVIHAGLAYEYDAKAGLVRVYENSADRSAERAEVDPGLEFAHEAKVWYLDEQGLSAVVEFLPDYRPQVRVDRSNPICVVRLPQKPRICGFH